MPSFGEKLKWERERRNTSIEQIASTTKIGRGYLEALERNKFEGLPGGAFGKLYIRAYAEVLGFDPQPLIAEYDRERVRRNRPDPDRPRKERSAPAARPRRQPRAWLQNQASPQGEMPSRAAPEEPTASPPQAPEPATPEDGPAAAPRPTGIRGRTTVLVALTTLAVGGWIYFTYLGGGAQEREVTRTPVASPQPAARLPEAIAIPIESAAVDSTATPSRLSVPDFGLGNRVVDRRLVERGDRFAEGAVAWFSTRVLGGEPGEFIRHVWLREGALAESIRLELGGPNWRTHSRKRLWGIGRWTVELRDAEGRVLATAAFDCVPAGSI